MPHSTSQPAQRLAHDLAGQNVASRIWTRDAALWIPDRRASNGIGRAIANRLGWLDAPQAMRQHLGKVSQLADAARAARIETVYLIGMGGSSLCAEVMRASRPPGSDWPVTHVLDTTDEETLTTAARQLDPERTWFLVSSKSGSTVEIVANESYFWSIMRRALGAEAGRHFIAITDPGTALVALAAERGYRATFLNPADIGGRFSALSLFGLVPAALNGLDVEKLLVTSAQLADGCREDSVTNPGLELGAFMAAACRAGRDKLTVLLPPSLRTLGLWIEQLVAESTGKQGTGLLPVVDEPAGPADIYGADRAFVALETESERVEADLAAFERAGHPVARLRMRSDALGAEFFRWEFATAVAGAALGINPFDEPNVTEAKDRTRALLSQYVTNAVMPDVPPRAGDVEGVTSLVKRLHPGDYFAALLYLPPEASTLEAIDQFRAAVRERTRVATTLGIGPRYLHSTGQYHKGGPDTGVFLVITGEDATATQVPDAPYTFSVLKRAQAIGDLQALEAHDRRVFRIHLKETVGRAAALTEVFAGALSAG